MMTYDGDSQKEWSAIPRRRQRVATVFYLLVIAAFVILVVKEFKRAVASHASQSAPAAASATSQTP